MDQLAFDHMPPVVEDPLFFLDYDGTLAPIVEDPEAAGPHPKAPELLRHLESRFPPVWIVTGRDLQSLSTFLDQPLNAIGLHGAQKGTVGGPFELLMSDEAAQALADLRESVPSVDGLRVEEKDQTFAVHYRNVSNKTEAQQQLEGWLDTMPEVLEAIWGKDVVELRPKGLSKGTAVRRIAEGHPDRTPVCLGDDLTDEDAFRALQEMERDAVTIKVGAGDTHASYRIEGPDAVMEYLEQYV